MKRILTGIQPTGVITLGNYIGAIKQMVKLQNEYDSYIFVANLHSITVFQDKKELSENTKSLLALYLACGLDENKNLIYLQSDIDAVPCISWLLECNSYFGELSRMTQFKDKSNKNKNFTTGLFTYPVLMASDILAVDSDFVPVGVDQKQHVELTRDLAIRFNNTYGKTFVVPEPLMSKTGTKIMDLQSPNKKMSKSAENQKGVIRLLDSEEIIRKKIMSATTDSEMLVKFDEEKKPGISNLMNIYSALSGKAISEIENEFVGQSYGVFKAKVADTVTSELMQIQKKYYEIIESANIKEMLNKNAKIINAKAKAKYEEMKMKMGLYV